MAPLLDLFHNLRRKFHIQVDSSRQIRRQIIHSTTVEEEEDDDEVRGMFEAWMIKYKKSYNSLAEKEKRFKIFKDHHRDIEEKNLTRTHWKEGLNEFSDLTYQETLLFLNHYDPTETQPVQVLFKDNKFFVTYCYKTF